MTHRRSARLGSTAALLLLLTGCSGGSEADGRASIDTPPVSTASSPEQAAAKSVEDEARSILGSGVDPEVAASYQEALGELRPAFDSFADDYAAAMERMDADAVLAAASTLRQAVADFDAAVRGLDLAAVQPHVDVLLALNDDVIATLDDVGTATSGAQAVRIMEMLPFRDYVLAYDAVADAL